MASSSSTFLGLAAGRGPSFFFNRPRACAGAGRAAPVRVQVVPLPSLSAYCVCANLFVTIFFCVCIDTIRYVFCVLCWRIGCERRRAPHRHHKPKTQ